MFRLSIVAGLAFGVAAAIGTAGSAVAEDAPQRGGTLTYAIQGAPNTFDCHAAGSTAVLSALSPAFSLLLKFDPDNWPKIVPDVAESWSVNAERTAYTFKLRPGVKFHDGSDFSAADVKATYDRLRNPPQGVNSLRQALFAPISTIETPDPLTVIFHMSKPSPGMELIFANPFNCLYSAKQLAANPKGPETVMNGTGPFKFDSILPGASMNLKRFDGYFRPGLPRLDELHQVFLNGPGIVNALSGGQVDATFTLLTPQVRETIRAARGTKTVFPEGPYNVIAVASINTRKAPFNDPRVRRALNLALDRHGGNVMVQKVSAMKNYGIAFPAGADQDISQAEMDKLPGFGTDMVAARAEARKLLAEAGVPNLHLTLLNRNTGEPYATAGIFMIDQWRQIGVDAVQNLVETAPYFAGLSSGNFDVAMDSNSTVSSDADEVLVKYLPDSSSNFSGGKDPELQSLYDKQALVTDPVERKKLIDDFQRRLIDDAYVLPLFRSVNIGAVAANIKGWKIMPSPTLNMDMAEVWIQK